MMMMMVMMMMMTMTTMTPLTGTGTYWGGVGSALAATLIIGTACFAQVYLIKKEMLAYEGSYKWSVTYFLAIVIIMRIMILILSPAITTARPASDKCPHRCSLWES
jgi:NADH:ubiquinone oxidoreductase subunit 3 (subunit A)